MRYFEEIGERVKGLNKDTRATNFLKKWYVCIPIFMIIYLISAIFVAKYNNTPIEYVAINGDFQTYNMFRRLLDGQIPFKDFVVYLGFGPLFLGSIFVAFNNTLSSSMIAVSVISSFMFTTTLTLCFYIVTKSLKRSILISIMLSIVAWTVTIPLYWYIKESVLKGVIYTKIYLLLKDITELMNGGNSLRSWRGFIAVIVSFAFIYFIKYKDIKIRKFLRSKNFYMVSSICGLIAGCIVPWSNDFGISSYVSISFCFFIWMIMNRSVKEVILGTLIYSISTLFSIYVLIILFTLGNFTAWFKYTLSVSNYQSWYFNTSKNLKFFTISMDIYIFIYLIVIIYNLYKITLRKEKKLSINYVYLFLFVATFVAAFLYQIGSCSIKILPNTYWLLDILAISYLINLFLKKILRRVRVKRLIVFGVYIVFVLSALLIGFSSEPIDPSYLGTYLGGNIDGYVPYNGYDLKDIDEYIGKRSYFSTYATGLEALRGEFPSSRYDYIIHVLGDENREEYLNDFSDNDYECVLTINPNYTNWEGWIQNANWYFYRHIYKEYAPQKRLGYNIIWEKGGIMSIDAQTDIEIIRLEDNQVKIIVKSSNTVDSIADVKISYDTNVKATSKLFSSAHHSMVNVHLNNTYFDVKRKDLYNDFFIPNQSSEYYIPIYVSEGEGYAVLTYLPDEYGRLNIKDVSIENVFLNTVHKSDEKTLIAPEKYETGYEIFNK